MIFKPAGDDIYLFASLLPLNHVQSRTGAGADPSSQCVRTRTRTRTPQTDHLSITESNMKLNNQSHLQACLGSIINLILRAKKVDSKESPQAGRTCTLHLKGRNRTSDPFFRGAKAQTTHLTSELPHGNTLLLTNK